MKNALKSTVKNSRKKAQETQKTNRLFYLLFLSFLCLFAANCAFAYSGGNGEPNTPYQIADVNNLLQLAADINNYDKYFILTADIDLAGHNFNNSVIAPTTYDGHCVPFGGVFDGAGHKIRNLSIIAGEGTCCLGLFGTTGSGVNHQTEIKNLGLEDVNITAEKYSYGIGGLAGWLAGTVCSNSYSTGVISIGLMVHDVGGLVGLNYGNINNCYSKGAIISEGALNTEEGYAMGYCGGFGGLVGVNGGWTNLGEGVETGYISNSWSSCNVTSGSRSYGMGGLVGANAAPGGNINNCYATGTVSGGYYSAELGGLVGGVGGYINACFSTGPVSGGSNSWGIGGLIGGCIGSVSNCYSTGDVYSGTDSLYIGGLVGLVTSEEGERNNYSGVINNCYSVGNVTASSSSEYVGGLVGDLFQSSIIHSYYLVTSGPDNGLGEPLTDSQMKHQASFVDWDFVGETANGTEDIWCIIEGITYPKLAWFGGCAVSVWPFSETSGLVVYDSSSHGHDGNIIDATRINDPVRGQCLKFDGTNDYVSVPDDPNLNITGEITISAWIYLESGGDSAQGIVTKTVDNGAFDNPFDFRTANGYLTLVRADEEGHDYVYSTQQVPINRWHHVLVRVDRNNVPDFYIDGVVTGKTVTSFTRTPTDNNNPVLIGKRDDGLYFKGSIDDVLIYNRALSDTEIQELYWGSLSYKASVPNPADNQTGVGTDVVLSWIPGNRAITHDLYFGTDFNEVNDADINDSTVYMGSQDANYWDVSNYNSNGLDSNTTYYWRIDEVTASATTKGDVWAFQTPILVDWWKFDESNGAVAHDSAGTHNGFVSGATWTTGHINGALSFDGINDSVYCGGVNYDNITVSAWMKTSTQGALVSNRYTSSGSGTWYTLFSNAIEIGDNSQGGYKYLYFDTNDTNTLDNAWHHIVYTKSGITHAIYVDGSLNQQFTSNANINNGSMPMYIGKKWNYSGGWFNGKIDDVRIYNGALSATEVLQLYQN
jgi:hypothetical protein